MINIKKLFETFPHMETRNLKIRQTIQEDSKDILEIFSNEEVVKYQGFEPMNRIEEAEGYIEWAQECYINKSFVRWAIEDKRTKKVIGIVGIYYINEMKSKVELSYNLNRTYWGKGIMKETLDEILSYLLDEIDMKVIEARIDIENLTSIKFAEKMGFRKGEIENNKVHYFYEK